MENRKRSTHKMKRATNAQRWSPMRSRTDPKEIEKKKKKSEILATEMTRLTLKGPITNDLVAVDFRINEDSLFRFGKISETTDLERLPSTQTRIRRENNILLLCFSPRFQKRNGEGTPILYSRRWKPRLGKKPGFDINCTDYVRYRVCNVYTVHTDISSAITL